MLLAFIGFWRWGAALLIGFLADGKSLADVLGPLQGCPQAQTY